MRFSGSFSQERRKTGIMHMRKRWWIAGILTVVLTAGFGTGNGNQQLNMAGQDGITHVDAAECPDE